MSVVLLRKHIVRAAGAGWRGFGSLGGRGEGEGLLWQTTAHYAKDIQEIISSCVVAQWGGATGVKQLSTLAAAGCVEDVIGPGKASKAASAPRPLGRATQRPPQGQSSQLAAMEVICLVVTAQQVSPGAGGVASGRGRMRWGGQGEVGLSKHLTRQEKKTAPQASVSGMSTTHGHSLIHHTHVTTTSVYPQFRPGVR